MKKHILALLLLAAAALAGAETMTVCLRGSVLYMRSSWDEKTDLVRICGLGGNKQFNYSYSALVDKKISDSDIMLKGKYYGRFHWCGDSTGVMHTYPEAPRKGVYILSGNHGYTGSEVTMPGHGYTQADIGKKLNETHRICGVLSKEKFRVLPVISKAALPKATAVKAFHNFQATRTLSRVYLLDGKPFPQNQILKGTEVSVLEKTGICTFDALMAAELKHDKVNDFYCIWDYVYSFYPNGSCRAECKITLTRDLNVMGISTMQDSDMEMGKNYDFYEKYIPKIKKFQLSEKTPGKGAQVFLRKNGKIVADTRPYDFEGVQDMTFKRRGATADNPRFEIAVKGGFVDPADLPDRWIEFMGKVENGKRVRKIGNVLGFDPTVGALKHSERAKNRLAFIIPAWNKSYPSHFSPGKKIVPKGTVLEMKGYRCYFNPEKIGDATALFVIPQKEGSRVYADFHKSVKDYLLPFAADAKTVILEKSAGVTLKGNKVSVAGSYGRIVVDVR